MDKVLKNINVDSFINEITPQLIQWRRSFHSYPEVGWTEYVTTYRIMRVLEKLNFILHIGEDAYSSVDRIGVPDEAILCQAEQSALKAGVLEEWIEKMAGGHTGLVATWDSGKRGKHIALRFDIDALPIEESMDIEHFPWKNDFRSVNQGTMHACGHDGHIATGLGVAHFIAEHSDVLTGKYTLFFQPAEEGGRGAFAMSKRGWLDDVTEFMSGHIGINPLNIGTVAATTTKFLASTKIDITYKGRSAHAGIDPEKGRNALLACAAATMHLQGITRNSGGATRINIGKINAGSGRNIVADLGRLEVETRGETDVLNDYMFEEAKRIINASGKLYDVQVHMDVVGHATDITCDEEWIDYTKEVCKDSKTITNVLSESALGGSEDVTYLMKEVQKNGGKVTYFIFGTPLANGHHHPAFDFDEKVLPIAVELYARMIVSLNMGAK